METNSYEKMIDFLYKQIPRGVVRLFPGKAGLERTEYFLKLLGSPQNKIKVVHIAGTSGKGSTATILSHLLGAQGFRVGLHISPFLVDLRERMQVDNELIPKKEVAAYFQEILPAFRDVEKSRYGAPTYFETLVVLAYFIFYRKNVHYAVVETGMGGWYDATNAANASNKFCIISRIGLDHTEILGKNVAEIAFQKGMILHRGNRCVALRQSQDVNMVLEKIAGEQRAEIDFLKNGLNFYRVVSDKQFTSFSFSWKDVKIKDLRVSLPGNYQAENTSLALASLCELGRRDGFKINEETVRNTLMGIRYAGRFEIKKSQGKTVILDAAHNPQKMRAFIGSLKKLYPGEKFRFLLAFKKGKDYAQMLRILTPSAEKLVISSFFKKKENLVHLCENPQTITDFIKKKYRLKVETVADPNQALQLLLSQSGKEAIVVTGSLYLLSSIYSHFQSSI